MDKITLKRFVKTIQFVSISNAETLLQSKLRGDYYLKILKRPQQLALIQQQVVVLHTT